VGEEENVKVMGWKGPGGKATNGCWTRKEKKTERGSFNQIETQQKKILGEKNEEKASNTAKKTGKK